MNQGCSDFRTHVPPVAAEPAEGRLGGPGGPEPADAAPGGRGFGSGRGPKPKAKHIIFLHQFGGPSHIDTFDMKPDAPDGIRGEFKPIASRASRV